MATTIQVAETTVEELRRLKGEIGVASYDEVLARLLMNHRKKTRPIRGITPGVGRFQREHRHRD